MIFEIKSKTKVIIEDIIMDLYGIKFDALIERPKSFEMGDIAVPLFILSKELKKSPVIIAGEVAQKIDVDFISSVEAVNGYINIRLNRNLFAQEAIDKIVKEQTGYGNGPDLSDKTVIVEYSSPNIAKPFHIGHIRTTLIGAALYRSFQKCGYNTVGINHLGDYGTQFGKLIVAIKAWGDRDVIKADPIPKLLELYIKFHDEATDNPALEDEAREWFTKLESGDEEAFELWQWIREVSLVEFNRVYDMFGIKFDSLAGESFYSDKMPAVLEDMKNKNVLVQDDGAGIVNLEEFNMPNALITKRDGSSMYITRDLAASAYRHSHYNFYINIYVVGHQQELHFKQWMKIHELMGNSWVSDCEHVSFGTVSLEDGSLSTRAGRVVFLEDVLNKAISRSEEILVEKNPEMTNKEIASKQIGIGAIVFQELFINRKKDYSFSWDKTLSFEGETGPYIQYTGVRIKSLLKSSEHLNYDNISFNDEISLDLWYIISTLMNFEEVLEVTTTKYDPSQLAKYALNLATGFNKFYASTKIFVDDATKTNMNLIICKCVLVVLEESLRILGIEIPDEM